MAVFVSGSVLPPSIGKDSFAANDWATIIKACQMNAVPAAWSIADKKSMTINGVEYVVDIIGKNHDAYADGTGNAPLTFQLHDCYATAYRMNGNDTNNGGWTSSQMRTTHIPAILALMPSEVKAALREVTKLTTGGSTSGTVVPTVDKLFLLSELEMFGVSSNSKPGEGKQYEYYNKGYSTAKKVNGTNSIAWLRSPRGTDSGSFCCIGSGGGASYYGASNTAGVSFAFCF